MDIKDLKKLAGVTDKHGNSMGENMSVIGSQKGEYQKKHNVEPGTDEWFKDKHKELLASDPEITLSLEEFKDIFTSQLSEEASDKKIMEKH